VRLPHGEVKTIICSARGFSGTPFWAKCKEQIAGRKCMVAENKRGNKFESPVFRSLKLKCSF